MYSQEEKKYLLNLAHQAIAWALDTGKILAVDENNVPSNLKEKRACFVTLTIEGQLRGCIGHLEVIQPLYLDVIENAVSAAFNDPRFNPLTKKELLETEIEVSILTIATQLNFSSTADLLQKLRPGIDGVILEKDAKSATFLPQVWLEMPDKAEFLSSLCLKAGLGANDWQTSEIKVSTYQVEIVK